MSIENDHITLSEEVLLHDLHIEGWLIGQVHHRVPVGWVSHGWHLWSRRVGHSRVLQGIGIVPLTRVVVVAWRLGVARISSRLHSHRGPTERKACLRGLRGLGYTDAWLGFRV